MRVQWMGSVMVLAVALAAMGCGSSSSTPTADAGGGGGTDGGGSTDAGGGTDGGGGTDAGGGATLATPVTVTMAMVDANHIAASICQQTIGGLQLSLDPQSYDAQSSSANCPGLGNPYISFFLNTSTGTYSARAGDKYDASGLVGTVTFVSTTQGSISGYQGRDQATPLPTDTSITIVTGLAAYPGVTDRTVTFQFSGNDVTVTAFTAS